ncbi:MULTISPECIES: lysophospholipid acyltransferase family protein [Rhodomicrobium]|uniref:lysophospholipid acyltransferase family protein n=1 Tax=Rhodomicrobium TaxID=1068 RepID=UPI000B4BFDB4|nr:MULTISPECIES: lysophospholipid acyltransferase family protein [Rhodomicrobium]
MGVLRASIILALFMLLTFVLLPIQAVLLALRLPLSRYLPCWYHRMVCGLLGVRVHLSGAPIAPGPALLVGNHISWLDIPVLGGIAPLSFVAKREVSTWPLISTLSKMQRTLFIDRNRRSSVAETRAQILARLVAGERIILFAEGTSSDGNQVLPFKSSLFAAIEPNGTNGGGYTLQTVAIVYTRVHGLPMNRQQRPAVAWYGDMDMASHAWGVLKAGPLDVHVRLGEPVALASVGDRKKLAVHAFEKVRFDFSQLLTGRTRQDHGAASITAETTETAPDRRTG